MSTSSVAPTTGPLAGQTFDPQSDDLRSLLAVPDDGVAYFRDRARARSIAAATSRPSARSMIAMRCSALDAPRASAASASS